jgi:hypothetical protein
MFVYKGKMLSFLVKPQFLDHVANNGAFNDTGIMMKELTQQQIDDYNGDLCIVAANIDDLNKYMIRADVKKCKEYDEINGSGIYEESLGEKTTNIPWTNSLQKVNSVMSLEKIPPHIIQIQKLPSGFVSNEYSEGMTVNESFKYEEWKDYGIIKELPSCIIQRFKVEESGKVNFPRDIAELFTRIGNLQRGDAEHAMKVAQKASGNGGPMCIVLEHMGDIYHRMTHDAKHGTIHQDLVHNKIEICLDSLRSGYGFEREYWENLEATASYHEKDISVVKEESISAIKKYSEDHSKLPTYNKMQWLAREACASLSNMDVKKTVGFLEVLLESAKNRNEFIVKASTVTRDKKGRIMEMDFGEYDLQKSISPSI